MGPGDAWKLAAGLSITFITTEYSVGSRALVTWEPGGYTE